MTPTNPAAPPAGSAQPSKEAEQLAAEIISIGNAHLAAHAIEGYKDAATRELRDVIKRHHGSPMCTCVEPFSSCGCSRCARYGNDEQRRQRAEQLASIIDAGNAALERTAPR